MPPPSSDPHEPTTPWGAGPGRTGVGPVAGSSDPGPTTPPPGAPRSSTSRRALRRTLVASAAALAAVGAVTASAVALTSGSTPTTTSPAAATGTVVSAGATSGSTPAKARRTLLARTDHATIELRRHGSWVTIDLDRGKVAAVSASSITLDRPDGQSVTLAITPTTRFRGVSGPGAVVTDQRATVVSENGSALWVAQHPKTASTGTTSSGVTVG
jgi:hypothetical protein